MKRTKVVVGIWKVFSRSRSYIDLDWHYKILGSVDGDGEDAAIIYYLVNLEVDASEHPLLHGKIARSKDVEAPGVNAG